MIRHGGGRIARHRFAGRVVAGAAGRALGCAILAAEEMRAEAASGAVWVAADAHHHITGAGGCLHASVVQVGIKRGSFEHRLVLREKLHGVGIGIAIEVRHRGIREAPERFLLHITLRRLSGRR